MKRIVLCEGKTDAILISYFLQKRFGWSHSKSKSNKMEFPFETSTETFNVYTHPSKSGQDLAIWGGKGFGDLERKLKSVADRNRDERDETNRYSRIVLFFDRDLKKDAECLQLIQDWLNRSSIRQSVTPSLGSWLNAQITLSSKPSKTYDLEILFIVLPPTGAGALETFLLDNLKTASAHEKNLVDEAEKFIVSIPDQPFLPKIRLRSKARLGSVLSVISPDWVFSVLNDRLTQVEWEQVETIMDTYRKLDRL